MSRNQTKAELMLKRLKGLKLSIRELEKEMNCSNILITSPQFSDMKVSGGIRQSQEDKNIAIISQNEWYLDKISELQKEKTKLLDNIYKLDDIGQINVLIAAYLTYDTFEEAWDGLNISSSTFYSIKRKAIIKLNEVISK
ncbi:hypothetical protein WA04_03965 [Streptococcus agalactiae]|uniref:DUF1492 domain-containing protein n=1 Tax=Streptococcus agalactiae TaxID=1311 RepID=A0A837KZS4_STRAG|nr:DUF1492 domain-containing protein [Streptococcus agalactiae]KLL40510.1 hypothetical protein WA04_03965 [Streptococcus agalactiae]